MTVSRKVWTLQLQGGEPVQSLLTPERAFPIRLDHAGGMTLCSVRLSEVEVGQLEELLSARGVRVRRWVSLETDEQLAERKLDEVVFLTPACPMCFWFDQKASGGCGARAWEQAVIREALLCHTEALRDAEACPLR